MPKSILTALFICLLVTPAYAQLPLADLPVRVGGYVYDQSGSPISGATVTFTDQSTQDEYQGTTDPSGWYGNVGFSAVPETPTASVLGQAYPNPFGSSTTIEVKSGAIEKSFGSAPQDLKIYDVRGRMVGSVPATNGTHEVQTPNNSSLPKSAYFYKLGDEVRKMVGSPKWVTVKISFDSGGEKALVQYRRVTEASDFEIEDVLVSLDDRQINFASVNLIPTTTSLTKPVAFQVRSIAGDQRQAIGEIVLRNASGVEFLALADVDSVYMATVEVASESELLTIYPRGMTGFTNGNYVILDPDSVAVRGWVGEGFDNGAPAHLDTAMVAFDHYALDKELFLEIVPDYRMSQGAFKQSVDVIFKRYYDRRVEIMTNTVESDFTVPVPEYALDRLRTAEANLIDMFENTPDGIPLIRTASVDELPIYSGDYENIAYRTIDNAASPGNFSADYFGNDGYMDYHAMYIRDSNGLGTASVEIANEFAHDLHDGSLGDLIDVENNCQYNALGRDVAATWAKFSNGRNFNPSLKDGGAR